MLSLSSELRATYYRYQAGGKFEELLRKIRGRNVVEVERLEPEKTWRESKEYSRGVKAGKMEEDGEDHESGFRQCNDVGGALADVELVVNGGFMAIGEGSLIQKGKVSAGEQAQNYVHQQHPHPGVGISDQGLASSNRRPLISKTPTSPLSLCKSHSKSRQSRRFTCRMHPTLSKVGQSCFPSLPPPPFPLLPPALFFRGWDESGDTKRVRWWVLSGLGIGWCRPSTLPSLRSPLCTFGARHPRLP